jgi:hypothetical protein
MEPKRGQNSRLANILKNFFMSHAEKKLFVAGKGGFRRFERPQVRVVEIPGRSRSPGGSVFGAPCLRNEPAKKRRGDYDFEKESLVFFELSGKISLTVARDPGEKNAGRPESSFFHWFLPSPKLTRARRKFKRDFKGDF